MEVGKSNKIKILEDLLPSEGLFLLKWCLLAVSVHSRRSRKSPWGLSVKASPGTQGKASDSLADIPSRILHKT